MEIKGSLLGRIIGGRGSEQPGEKWGLVLSGGGTKGAYEIGALRAVRELRLPIRGIAGTSIGALNAALFLCQDIEKIEKIYREIRITDVLPVDGNIDPEKNVFDPANLLAITKEYFARRGLTNAPLRRVLEANLDIGKIYASPLDLGIVTFDVSARTAVDLFKEDIERDKLIDYLLASANFPIYRTQDVDGKKFLDGGLYDNMPFNLLIERGYTHLVVIDINGLGSIRRVDRADRVYLKMVECSEDLGGTFDFNRERIRRNLRLGYLDTMKAFHKLFGNTYFFRRPAFNDLLLNFDLETIGGLETAAKYYQIDRCRIYRAEEFLDLLEQRHREAEAEFARAREGASFFPNLPELRRMRQSGTLIPGFVNLFTEQPSARNSAAARAFPDMAAAARAVIELKNRRKL